MEAQSGGGDVELLCRTLQVEHKLFYFDLKENPRGRYLKISEKTSATRSTIIVPDSGIVWFHEIFNYYVSTVEQEAVSKELQLDTKVFYFDVGSNKRGRFLKISEASANRNRSTIIVPGGSGSQGDDGWVSFRDILAQIILSHQQGSENPDRILGLSDDVGVGFISQSASRSEVDIDRSADHPQHDEIGGGGGGGGGGGHGMSKVLRADQKRFFFDLGSNNRGHFLKISEVAGADRSSIILPLSALTQFHEMVGHFVELTKDRLEGGSNARAEESGQR
ncbi:purin-rich alpha 1 [Wolffia australiana]